MLRLGTNQSEATRYGPLSFCPSVCLALVRVCFDADEVSAFYENRFSALWQASFTVIVFTGVATSITAYLCLILLTPFTIRLQLVYSDMSKLSTGEMSVTLSRGFVCCSYQRCVPSPVLSISNWFFPARIRKGFARILCV